MTYRYLILLMFISGCLSIRAQTVSKFELAVTAIKWFERLHGPSNYPYVGYGHRLNMAKSYHGGCLKERQTRSYEKICRGFVPYSGALAVTVFFLPPLLIMSGLPVCSAMARYRRADW